MDYYYDDYEMNYGNVPKRLKNLYKAGSDDFYNHVPEFKEHKEYAKYDKCSEYSNECYVDTIRDTLENVFDKENGSLTEFVKELKTKKNQVKNEVHNTLKGVDYQYKKFFGYMLIEKIDKLLFIMDGRIKDIETHATKLQRKYSKNDYLKSGTMSEPPLTVEGINLHLCASRLPEIVNGKMSLSGFKSAMIEIATLREKVEHTIKVIEKDQKTILQSTFDIKQKLLRAIYKKPYTRAMEALDKKENEYIKLGKKLLKLKSEKNVYKEIQSKQHIINKLVDKVFAEAAEAETGQRFEPELPIEEDPEIKELYKLPKIEKKFNNETNERVNEEILNYAVNNSNKTPDDLFAEFKSLGLCYENKKDLFEEIVDAVKLSYDNERLRKEEYQRLHEGKNITLTQTIKERLEILKKETKTFINLIKFYPFLTLSDENIPKKEILEYIKNVNNKRQLHKLKIHPDKCLFRSTPKLKVYCEKLTNFLSNELNLSFGSALVPYLGKRKRRDDEMSLVEAPEESTLVEYSPEQKKAKKQEMTKLAKQYRQFFATQQVQKTLDTLGEELRSNIMTIVKKEKTPQEEKAKKKMLLKLVKKNYLENMFYNFKKYRWRKIARPFTNTGKKIYNNYVAIINNIPGISQEKWQPKYETIEYVDYNKNLELILSTEPNKIQKEIEKIDDQILKFEEARGILNNEIIPKLNLRFRDARKEYIVAYQELIGKDPTLDKTLWQRIRNLPGQYDITKFPGDATFETEYRGPLQIPFKKIIGQLTGVKYCLKLLVGSSGGSKYKKGFMGLVLWLIENKGKPIPEEPEYEPESSLMPPPEAAAAIVPFHSADVEELIEQGFEPLKSPNGIIENQLRKIRKSDCSVKGCFRPVELESLQGLFSLPGLIYSNMQLWMSCNEGCRQFFNDLFKHLHKHKGCFDSLTRDQLLYRKNENGSYEFKIQKESYKRRKGRFNKGISSENCMKQMLENGFLNEYLLGNHTLTPARKNEYNKFWLTMYCQANGIKCKNMVKCSKNTKKQLRKEYPELAHLFPIKYWEM